MAGVASTVWNRVVRAGTGKTGEDADALGHKGVDSAIDEYVDMYDENGDKKGHDASKIGERKTKYTTLVNHYYDLVTDFYEYGWGQSFHFAPRFDGETFDASLARHEHYLAFRLGIKAGDRVADMGCGVGGPMRAIARFSSANVVGVNNNDYQIKRANMLNKKMKLSHLCEAVKGNFMDLPFEANSFDHIYAIEATCHAPDKVGCYAQMYKALKPGGCFAAYEWCVTDRYDARNADHRAVKHGIEKGDGLPDMVHPSKVVEALKTVGFEVVDSFDAAETAPKDGNEVPWYSTLQGSVWSPSQFRHSALGRFCTQRMVNALEAIKVAPKGTGKTHEMLCTAADNLAKGGEWGIFTPMFFFIARKPLDAE